MEQLKKGSSIPEIKRIILKFIPAGVLKKLIVKRESKRALWMLLKKTEDKVYKNENFLKKLCPSGKYMEFPDKETYSIFAMSYLNNMLGKQLLAAAWGVRNISIHLFGGGHKYLEGLFRDCC